MRANGRRYLYEIVSDALREEILNGTYACGVSLPAERDISIRFGVDRATVRKALSLLVTEGFVEKRAGAGTKVLCRETACDGKDAAAESAQTRGLVCFLINEQPNSPNKKITQPFYADLFYYLENECKKYDANLIYSTISSSEDMENLLAQRHFSGIVFASQTDESYIQQAAQAGIRAVAIPGFAANGLTVCYDDVLAGSLAVEHFIRKGHCRIAFITGPESYMSSRNRFAGALSALYRQGISLPQDYVQSGDWEYASGYTCAQKLMELPQQPTAIYIFNDMMALGAMDAIKNAHLRIPEDISLIGNDNMRRIQDWPQQLTTTGASIASIAHIALNYCFKSDLTDLPGVRIVVPVSLVEGSTVRDLNPPSCDQQPDISQG